MKLRTGFCLVMWALFGWFGQILWVLRMMILYPLDLKRLSVIVRWSYHLHRGTNPAKYWFPAFGCSGIKLKLWWFHISLQTFGEKSATYICGVNFKCRSTCGSWKCNYRCSSASYPWSRPSTRHYQAKSHVLTREEVLRRRLHHVKQLSRCYRGYYWALMEELKSKLQRRMFCL